jgi:hypothetical protein
MPTAARPRRLLTVIAVALVVALVAVLVGGEIYARHRVKSCLSNQLGSQFGTKVSVGLGLKPVLIDMLDHNIPSLTIDTAGDRFGPAIGMKVHAKLTDIRTEDNGKRAGTIASSSADVHWSSDGIADTLKEALAGTVTGVKTNAGDGTLEIDGILGAQLVVKPVVADDKIEVKTQNAQVLGFGLPTDLVDSVVKLITASLQQNYPLGMTVKSVRVVDDGVQVGLQGGQYDLPRQEGHDFCSVASTPSTTESPAPTH